MGAHRVRAGVGVQRPQLVKERTELMGRCVADRGPGSLVAAGHHRGPTEHVDRVPLEEVA